MNCDQCNEPMSLIWDGNYNYWQCDNCGQTIQLKERIEK